MPKHSRGAVRRHGALLTGVRAIGGRGENTMIRAIDSKCRAMRNGGGLRRSCGGNRLVHETGEGAEAALKEKLERFAKLRRKRSAAG